MSANMLGEVIRAGKSLLGMYIEVERWERGAWRKILVYWVNVARGIAAVYETRGAKRSLSVARFRVSLNLSTVAGLKAEDQDKVLAEYRDFVTRQLKNYSCIVSDNKVSTPARTQDGVSVDEGGTPLQPFEPGRYTIEYDLGLEHWYINDNHEQDCGETFKVGPTYSSFKLVEAAYRLLTQQGITHPSAQELQAAMGNFDPLTKALEALFTTAFMCSEEGFCGECQFPMHAPDKIPTPKEIEEFRVSDELKRLRHAAVTAWLPTVFSAVKNGWEVKS